MEVKSILNASNYFTLPKSLSHFKDYFPGDIPVWEWINSIKIALAEYGSSSAQRRDGIPQGLTIEGDVFIHASVKLPPYGYIQGPAYIAEDCELRPGVYFRGNVIVGKGCVLGNSCEYKNCLLMDDVESAHFNYVGDSILGNKTHLGAGVVLANVRLDRKNVMIKTGDEVIDTKMRKMGAVLGDGVAVGCNTVLQPGTIIGKKAAIGPAKAVGGVY